MVWAIHDIGRDADTVQTRSSQCKPANAMCARAAEREGHADVDQHARIPTERESRAQEDQDGLRQSG